MTIKELAKTIAKVVNYSGDISLDPSKPDGTLRKLMDSARLNALGWQAKVDMVTGLEKAYQDFLENQPSQASKVKNGTKT